MSPNPVLERLDAHKMGLYEAHAAMSLSELRARCSTRGVSALSAIVVDLIDQIEQLESAVTQPAPSTKPLPRSQTRPQRPFVVQPGTVCATVLATLARLGVAHSDNVESATDLPHATVSVRMLELRRAGMIEAVDSAPTRRGRNATRYKLTGKGRSTLDKLG